MGKLGAIIGGNVENIIHLLFPNSCLICSAELSREEKKICISCFNDLPRTKFNSNDVDNPAQQLFWGRVNVENVFCWLSYNKDQSTKDVLHHIKYKDNPQFAQVMGAKLGEVIQQYDWVESIDALIPVPIHPKKKFIRGYNQSEELAKGLEEVLAISIDNHFLNRALHTDSQTKKGRFGRWDNIENVFRSNKNAKNYKHIAIVDDVITTGATMERIIQQIHEKNPDLRVSLISLAFAQ